MSETVNYKPAGFWVRSIAYAVDTIITYILLLLVALVAILVLVLIAQIPSAVSAVQALKDSEYTFDSIASIVGAIAYTVCNVGYYIYCYNKFHTTPGKILFEARLVSKNQDEKLSRRKIFNRVAILELIPSVLVVLIAIFVSLVPNDFAAGEEVTLDESFGIIALVLVSVYPLYQAVLYFINPFVIGIRKDKRGIHDLIAGTKVVKKV